MKVITFFIPPWILLQTNHQQPVEVQLLGGTDKVEEELELREEAEEEEGGGGIGEEGGEEEYTCNFHFLFSFHKQLFSPFLRLR